MSFTTLFAMRGGEYTRFLMGNRAFRMLGQLAPIALIICQDTLPIVAYLTRDYS